MCLCREIKLISEKVYFVIDFNPASFESENFRLYISHKPLNFSQSKNTMIVRMEKGKLPRQLDLKNFSNLKCKLCEIELLNEDIINDFLFLFLNMAKETALDRILKYLKKHGFIISHYKE